MTRCTGGRNETYTQNLSEKGIGKRPLGRYRHRWKGSTKIYIKEKVVPVFFLVTRIWVTSHGTNCELVLETLWSDCTLSTLLTFSVTQPFRGSSSCVVHEPSTNTNFMYCAFADTVRCNCLYPGFRQELHEPLPSATNSYRCSQSQGSATVSDVMLSAGYCCVWIWFHILCNSVFCVFGSLTIHLTRIR